MKCEISELQNAINNVLDNYEMSVSDIVKEELAGVSKECVKIVKKNSPVKTGKYKKGWKAKQVNTRLKQDRIIYNESKPSLTHLLEHGHAKQSGGRVEGTPHISIAEDLAVEQLPERVKKRLKS